MKALGAHPEATPELTLELARLSAEPLALDKSRNLVALRSRLALPLPATTTPGLNGPAAAESRSAASPSGAARPAAALAPWSQSAAVGIVAGALGFILGLHFDGAPTPQPAERAASVAATRLEAASHLQALEAAATSPAVRMGAATAEAAASPAAETPANGVGAVGVAGAAPPRAASNVSRTSSSDRHRDTASSDRRRDTASSDRRRSTTKPTSTQPAERSPDFLQAVQLLARARRALDRGEPALALGLLDELDARFPREMLDEERGATRVLGLCASGERPAAVALAERLFSGRPRSIYTRRIERSCAGAELTSRSEP